jgi:hypothetical protein
MALSMTVGKQRRGVGAAWLTPLALFIAAGLLYSVNLGRLPHPDEYYHILAAQGMVASGEPRIAEGLYTRVLLHTWLVAQSFRLFGESLAVARLPSLLAMAGLVSLLFVWLRREAGPLAAWIGTALFALSPFTVEIAQFCRFYALQSLAFFGAATLVYGAVVAPAIRRRLALLALAMASLLLAVYLQPTTILGSIGLGLWAAGAVGLPWLRDRAIPYRRKLLVLAAACVAGIVVLAAAAALGLLSELWLQYRSTPLFNQSSSEQFWYYHGWYDLLYPSLWPATAVLALLAVVARPAPASMALLVFAIGFLLNSFAAAKNLRYIAYAQPFLFILWGIGLAALWPRLAALVEGVRDGLGERLASIGGGDRLAGLLTGAAVLFLVAANPAWVRTALLLADVTVPPEQPRTNWPAARETLAPWLARADIVVTTEELGHLYFLGRYDVRFSPSKLDELAPGEQHEFGIDYRTGRPVISTRESLERVLDCYPTGLIVGPAPHWGRPELITNELAALIAAHAQPLPLPPRSQLRAYVWERPAISPRPAICDGLPVFPKSPPAAE